MPLKLLNIAIIFLKTNGFCFEKNKKTNFKTHKKSMKVKNFMALLLFGSAISGMKAQTMYVRPLAGAQAAYPVANIQKLTFSGGNLLVTNSTGGNGTFALSGNRYINFTDLTLGNTSNELVKNSFYVYPNPTSTILSVVNDDLSQTITRLEIISLEERVLKEQISPQVSLESLPQGMYFCRITSNRQTQTIKFLKQ